MYEKLNSSYKELSDSMLKDKKLTDEIKDWLKKLSQATLEEVTA
jgi:hypothetical protein